MQFQRQSLSPLNHKEFRLYILVRFFYIMALRMVATIVAYELYHLTKSSFAIGIVGLSEFVPVFFLALYAGHVIDRSDKRTLLLKGILSYSACVVLLILVTIPSVQESLSTSLLSICFYIIIFFTGIIRAFAGPASNAIMAQLVPKQILHFAASISSTSWLAASLTGHALAGILIALVGVHACFYIIFFIVMTAAFLLSRIERKPVMHRDTGMKT